MQVISTNNDFASGGKRLLAFLIDWFLLHTAFSILLFRWWGSPFHWDVENWGLGLLHFLFIYIINHIITMTVTVLYYSYMESSRYQATIGKLALGIKVVGVRGGAIDFPRALLRNLSKYLSALIFCVGYIMILVDDRNQGLHDKIADTLVVNQ